MNPPQLAEPFVASARAAAALALFAFAFSGCGKPATDTAAHPAGDTAAAADADHDHAGDSHDGHSHDAGGDVEAALAKLTPEDRALAQAQKVCVVSKEPLGSMGAPIKVEHNGQVAFLCCDGCRDAFEAEPDKFLAELTSDAGAEETAPPADAAPAAEPAADTPAEGT